MSEDKKGRQPDYIGNGIAVWVNETKDKKPYLSITILGALTVAAFKNEPKEKKEVAL